MSWYPSREGVFYDGVMSGMTISMVARQIGIQPSAIRYYEQIGLLPAPPRVSGQRSYDSNVLHRLSVVQRARQLGFTLEEIRQLFFGFRPSARASLRWQKLSRRKLTELDQQMHDLQEMQHMLREMIAKCECVSLDQCGKGIFQSDCTGKKRPRAVRS